ncbi:MAG: hypothetical protein ACO3M3_08555 [Flavobacteriaceae bacterium]|jgi:uncharacterized membrane-anchored protein
MISSIKNKLLDFKNSFLGRRTSILDTLDDQDLSRFSEQDLILETDTDIQKYLPDVLGQALARTWVDKRFLDAFFNYPIEILERGGVYLPEKIQLEFSKEEKSRPKVTVFERTKEGRKKVLELKLIMVAEK